MVLCLSPNNKECIYQHERVGFLPSSEKFYNLRSDILAVLTSMKGATVPFDHVYQTSLPAFIVFKMV